MKNRLIIAFKILLIVMVLLVGYLYVKPYWFNYWLDSETEGFATACTKKTLEQTKTLMSRRLLAAGYEGFEVKDFTIEKDSARASCMVSIIYDDEINIFGLYLKPIEFVIEHQKHYTGSTF